MVGIRVPSLMHLLVLVLLMLLSRARPRRAGVIELIPIVHHLLRAQGRRSRWWGRGHKVGWCVSLLRRLLVLLVLRLLRLLRLLLHGNIRVSICTVPALLTKGRLGGRWGDGPAGMGVESGLCGWGRSRPRYPAVRAGVVCEPSLASLLLMPIRWGSVCL